MTKQTEAKLLSFSQMLQEQEAKERVAEREIQRAEPPQNWTARQPEVDNQTARVDNQTANNITGQPELFQKEKCYPSRRNRTQITVRLPSQKVEKYKLWCFVNKVDLQEAIERGLDFVTGQPDSQTATYQFDDTDDALIDDESSSILDFYAKWTRNKPTKKDKEAVAEIAHLSAHVIKCGVLLSLQRAKGRINSFRYCIGAIEETAESGAGAEYLHYLAGQLKKAK
jgi:exonuclease VII large subunit